MSDVYSRILLNQSRISDTYSLLSDLYSDFQSRVPKRVATDSQLSDVHSDLASKIGVITASDIASAVWNQKYTAASNVKASTFGSAVRLNMSRISDLQSLVSDVHSDLRSYLVGLSGSLSDVESQLDATDATLSDFKSDFQSRVPKAVATNSQLSDLASDLRSYMVGLSATVSDTYSLLSDLQSDFQSRVPKRVATDSQLSNLHSDLSARLPTTLSSGRMRADVESLGGNASAVTNLRQASLGILTGSAIAGTLSTTQMSTDLTFTDADAPNGRLLTFLTGNLVGQQVEITDAVVSNHVLTFTAVTQTVVAGDTFFIS